jgi:hypothetical protein
MRRRDCVIIPDRNYSLTKYLADADGGSKRILLLIGARVDHDMRPFAGQPQQTSLNTRNEF